tara:strand:- start:346 stop:576 length:231 start_codon:yes stop_codon:yes gene_type:complete
MSELGSLSNIEGASEKLGGVEPISLASCTIKEWFMIIIGLLLLFLCTPFFVVGGFFWITYQSLYGRFGIVSLFKSN